MTRLCTHEVNARARLMRPFSWVPTISFLTFGHLTTTFYVVLRRHNDSFYAIISTLFFVECRKDWRPDVIQLMSDSSRFIFKFIFFLIICKNKMRVLESTAGTSVLA